jgi:hypothetical protein
MAGFLITELKGPVIEYNLARGEEHVVNCHYCVTARHQDHAVLYLRRKKRILVQLVTHDCFGLCHNKGSMRTVSSGVARLAAFEACCSS